MDMLDDIGVSKLSAKVLFKSKLLHLALNNQLKARSMNAKRYKKCH